MKRLKKFLKRSSILFLFALLITFFCKFSMSYFGEAIGVYIESLIIGYATEVIDTGVSKEVVELLDGKSVLTESYDSTGKVTYAYVDVKTINYIRNNASRYIANCIDIINQGETLKTIELPLGYFFGHNYLFSKGIRVPIDLEVVGNQEVEIEKTIESYGLNTTVLEINLAIAINIRSVIPFQTKIIQTKVNVPIAIEILNNDIPYYLGDIFK